VGPSGAIFYNLFEIRVDANKLVRFYQRPNPATADSIGPWNTLFAMLTVFGVFTNAYTITYLYPTSERLRISSESWAWADRTYTTIQQGGSRSTTIEADNADAARDGSGSPLAFFMAVQYAMFFVIAILVFVMGTGNPTHVEKILTKQRVLSERAVFEKLMKRLDAQRADENNEIMDTAEQQQQKKNITKRTENIA
jgi:hypothetical protein